MAAQVDQYLGLRLPVHPPVVGELDVPHDAGVLVPAAGLPQVHARTLTQTSSPRLDQSKISCARASTASQRAVPR